MGMAQPTTPQAVPAGWVLLPPSSVTLMPPAKGLLWALRWGRMAVGCQGRCSAGSLSFLSLTAKAWDLSRQETPAQRGSAGSGGGDEEEENNGAGAGLLPGSQGGQVQGSTPDPPPRDHSLLQPEAIGADWR